MDCLLQLVRTEGLGGLGRGLPSVWMRDVPFNFVFFGAYELYSAAIGRWLQAPRDQLPAASFLVAGGLAGATGWTIVFPFDVVKTHLQTQTTQLSVESTVRRLFAEGGVRAFYRGWSAAIVRAFPANGFLFLGYELSHRCFAWMENA
jgi:hypothetical protein